MSRSPSLSEARIDKNEGVPEGLGLWYLDPVRLEKEIAQIASAQHGLVTRTQLRGLGLSPAAIDRRLGVGRLAVVHPEVYLIGGSARSRSQELLAAVLSMGGGAALSHLSAAMLWGMLSGSPQIHVATPRPRWKDKPFIVHRSTDLEPRYIMEVEGTPVTTPARTIVDLGVVGLWAGHSMRLYGFG